MRGVPLPLRIVGVTPSGSLPGAPTSFAWSVDDTFDSYLLEVFTEDLEAVLKLSELTTTQVALPDSLGTVFSPGTTYFWHVTGRSGLADTEASTPTWFRIDDPAAQ